MSVFDRRPLSTNICKYANLISLFSSHWTICTMAWTWQKLLCRGGVNGNQMATPHAWNITLFTIYREKPPDKNSRAFHSSLSWENKKNIWILLMFALNCNSLLPTCTIYLFLISLKYKMHEIVASKACMYFVATVWWGNLYYIRELVVANKWWKSLVTLSVIKKCLLKLKDK